MKVLKFGGTSVGSAERFRNVVSLIIDRKPCFVVISAMSGTTNALVDICEWLYDHDADKVRQAIDTLHDKYRKVLDELFTDPERLENVNKTLDTIFESIERNIGHDFNLTFEKEVLACGELMSTAILQAYFEQEGVNSVLLPALDFMRACSAGEPDMQYISNNLRRLMDAAPSADVYLTQGYICRNAYGEIDNLRRGGSDYTATIIGAAIDAEVIEIWTDIDGMHTGDPRYVEGTRPVKQLCFEEAAELAYFGAKILHPLCVRPAKHKGIPVKLLNTLDPKAGGTTIGCYAGDNTLKAVAAKDGITLVKFKSRRVITPGEFFGRIFSVIQAHNITVDAMTSSQTEMTVALDNVNDFPALLHDLEPFARVSTWSGKSLISVVGAVDSMHMSRHMEQVCAALAPFEVSMLTYGSSPYSILAVVEESVKPDALNALNTKLFSK